jgi:hypothetical protein
VVIVPLLLVMLIIPFQALAAAQPIPYVLTDKPLYTLRDKQVLLQGGGFAPAEPYYVWLQGPGDNSTRNTGVTFVTTEKGELPSIPPATTPPAVVLPITRNSTLGTYLVSISNSTASDSSTTRAHYGIWDTAKSGYQRTEIVQAGGGGILPKETLRVTIRNPAGTIVQDISVGTDDTGAFLATWKIPPDALTESYAVLIQGVGTYDDAQVEFVSTSRFSVAPAMLNVTVQKQPDGAYQRTQSVSAEFAVLYPDSSPVVSEKENLKPVALYADQFRRADLSLAAADITSGIWIAERTIQKNATLSAKYRFVMVANAFDDGYGNTGPETNVETGNFTVLPAALQVSVILNSTHYQVPLDAITAYVSASYPDASPVTNATVRAWLSSSGSIMNASVTYEKTTAVWIVGYRFSLGDLIRPGAWTLSVETADIYGNSGAASLELIAEPYYFITLLVLTAFVLLLVRWFLSRYWRRLYLRAKRVPSAFRNRWKPHLSADIFAIRG